MRTLLRRKGLRYQILILLIVWFVPACGDGGPSATSSSTSKVPPTSAAPAATTQPATSLTTTTRPVATTSSSTTSAVTTTPPTAPSSSVLVSSTESALLSLTIDIAPGGLPFVTAATSESVLTFACVDKFCSDIQRSSISTVDLSPGTQAVDFAPDGLPVIRLGPLPEHPDQVERGVWISVVACEDPACSSFVDTRIDDATASYSRGGLVVSPDGTAYVLGHIPNDGAVLYECASLDCSNAIQAMQVPPRNAWSFVLVDGVPVMITAPSVQPARATGCHDSACEVAVEWVFSDSPVWFTSMAPMAASPDGRLALLTHAGEGSRPSVPWGTLALTVGDSTDPTPGTTVVLDTIDGDEDLQAAAVTMDEAGRPIIAWVSVAETTRLFVARCDDPTCSSGTTSLVVEDNRGCGFIDVALDADGLVYLVHHLSGLEGAETSVVVTRCIDPGCIIGSLSVSEW